MKLSVRIYKGEKYFIGKVPELRITTQGKTREEVKKNLREAVKLHLETMVDYMIDRGNIKLEKSHMVPIKR